MAASRQKIGRLVSLGEALARMRDAARACAPVAAAPDEAVNCVLAHDVVAPRRPERATAARDGWAVCAADIADAGSYSPVPLAQMPPWVEAGDDMPPGTDAVAAADAIAVHGGLVEALGAVAPGDGVIPAGGDTGDGVALRRAGQRMRAVDAAVFVAAGIERVEVRRPSVALMIAREDMRLRPALQFITGDCVLRGATPMIVNGGDVRDAMRMQNADALVVIGGTGEGRRDSSVADIAEHGRLLCHGIAIAPGETAALATANTGAAGGFPALAVPGRLDAAIGAWTTLGRPMLARLAGQSEADILTTPMPLTRKIASTIGVVDVVPVRRSGSGVEPLGTKLLALSALAGADGFVLVPADSEGFAEGATVPVEFW